MAAKWLRWVRDGMAEGNLKPNFHHVYVTILSSQLEGIFSLILDMERCGKQKSSTYNREKASRQPD